MSIKKALFGGVETSATASYQGSIQDWLPVKNIIGGVVITKDNRFIKILEIVPVNIYLKSAEDRQAIVEAFAAYLKIAPDHMQFEARTLPADISRYTWSPALRRCITAPISKVSTICMSMTWGSSPAGCMPSTDGIPTMAAPATN